MLRVRWERRAADELTRLWLQGDSVLRAAITAASHAIDQRLQTDPIGQSESRSGGRRILLASPLGITFRIEADGQTVSVLRVWLFHKRGP